jgi:hypothetical protein
MEVLLHNSNFDIVTMPAQFIDDATVPYTTLCQASLAPCVTLADIETSVRVGAPMLID